MGGHIYIYFLLLQRRRCGGGGARCKYKHSWKHLPSGPVPFQAALALTKQNPAWLGGAALPACNIPKGFVHKTKLNLLQHSKSIE